MHRYLSVRGWIALICLIVTLVLMWGGVLIFGVTRW